MNVSEGRDPGVLDELAAACGADLLDRHADPDHHRSVFTLVGEEAPRAPRAAPPSPASTSRAHAGVHPRLGVVDVVPFVPLAGATLADAVAARDAFAAWAGDELALPCFRYGPERIAARGAPAGLRRPRRPTPGPAAPTPPPAPPASGARPFLVAYNVWLAEPDLDGPGGWRPPCARRRCGPSAWPAATGCR